MSKLPLAIYIAAVLFAIAINANIDPQQAASVSQQLTNSELGVSLLN